MREYQNGTYPPSITPLLENSTFTSAIGAEAPWTNASTEVYIDFSVGGDWMVSFAPQLEQVINAGVSIFGDIFVFRKVIDWIVISGTHRNL